MEQLTVLGIDQNPSDLRILKNYLAEISRWEIRFLEFSDPASGLEALGRENVDLIVIDYLLGESTGITLLNILRGHGYEQPVIFLTHYEDQERAVEAMQRGAADYISKTILSSRVLERSVSHAIEKYRLRQALECHRRELERYNADLRRKNEEIQGFYHWLSHELRSPLTSALEFLSMIEEESAGPLNEAQREMVNFVHEGCRDMARHVSDLLDSARLETGKLRLHKEEFAISWLIHKVAAQALPFARAKGVELAEEVPQRTGKAFADPLRLTQVLTNLTQNALKFTPPGGKVSLRAKRKAVPPVLEIAVSDTGRGIPEEQLTRLGERLFQVDPDDSLTHGGLGLGLFICRELLRLHDGALEVRSTPEHGTTFTAAIPLPQSNTLNTD